MDNVISYIFAVLFQANITPMTSFPVSSSILSASHLAAFVQAQYHLSPATTCRLLKAGINHVYLITDGSAKFIFRVYSLHWRLVSEIEAEIRLLNLLKDNHIPVSYAIATPAGNYILEVPAPEGTRLAVLFSYANGEKALNFSPDIHFGVGAAMAKMHLLTHNLSLNRVVYTSDVLAMQPLPLIRTFLGADTEEMHYLTAVAAYIKEVYDHAAVTTVRRGVVHFDIWYDNMHFTDDGDITLFDFDFCGNGLLCHDLAYYILQLHSTEREEAVLQLKKDSFLAGYESVTKISDDEKRLIPALGLASYLFYLGIQCLRYDNWSNTFLNEIYLKRFTNLLLKKWGEHHGLLYRDGKVG